VEPKKILLIDDSDVVLEANKIALEEQGFSVITLDNPFAVPYVVRKELPDLVLVDVNMPTMKGDLVARIIANYGLDRRAPILLHSDLSDGELKVRAEKSGAAGFIRKTADRRAFVENVRRWLKAG
jgi:two-component system, OmpR family, response regulator